MTDQLLIEPFKFSSHLLHALEIEDLFGIQNRLQFSIEHIFPLVGVGVSSDPVNNDFDRNFEDIGAGAPWLHLQPFQNILGCFPVANKVEEE